MSDPSQLLGEVAARLEAGQFFEAEKLCLIMTEAATSEPGPRHALGVVYAQQQRFADALDCFDRVLESEPDHAPALMNRGNVLRMLGHFDESLASFDRALAVQPGYIPVFCNRASLLFEMGRFKDALSDFEAVLLLQPKHAAAMVGRGNALRQLAQLEAKDGRSDCATLMVENALDDYREAIRLQPDFAEAYYNLGMALHHLDRPDEAVENYGHAIRLQPELAAAHSDLGVAEFEAGQLQQAIASLNKAIDVSPGTSQFEWNKSLYLLATGMFEEGWPLYESRFAGPKVPARAFGWLNSEDLNGKSICIWAEQGLGDTIQFCRYALLAKRRGAKVSLRVQDRLVRLLSQLSPAIDVISSASDGSHHDYNIPLLSLPFAFGTRLDSVPADIPYLKAEPEITQHWKAVLGAHGYKIGVAWQGTSATKRSAARSFPFQYLSGISSKPGVRLINLLKDSQMEGQLHGTGVRIETLGPQFDAGDDGFLDTAAVMQNLDLIITSDSAIAHLAGALGRPTWVALKMVPDWRWLLERGDSPWYPTMKLFRQKARGEWEGVFQAMEVQLATHMQKVEWVSGNA